MIINTNKLTDIKKITFDLTDGRPFIYYLFQINEDTPRYSRINGKFVEDKNGTFIMDNGPNFFKQESRTLVYVGQTTASVARIYEHYWAGTRGKSKSKLYAVKKFNYFRLSKSLKMFQFDSIRQHYEKIIVRKYLPFYNQASRFNNNQVKLIINSNGKINPRELMKPYVINSRDIYKAFKAWESEDAEYLKNELERPLSEMFKMTKLKHPTRNLKQELTYYDNRGSKLKFGRFIETIIVPFHKKQRKAIVEARQKLKTWIKIFDPARYKLDAEKARVRNKDNYEANKEFISKRQNEYRRLLRKINQPKLI